MFKKPDAAHIYFDSNKQLHNFYKKIPGKYNKNVVNFRKEYLEAKEKERAEAEKKAKDAKNALENGPVEDDKEEESDDENREKPITYEPKRDKDSDQEDDAIDLGQIELEEEVKEIEYKDVEEFIMKN